MVQTIPKTVGDIFVKIDQFLFLNLSEHRPSNKNLFYVYVYRVVVANINDDASVRD